MYLVIWEFIVPEANREEFERIYGPEGDWSRFFARMNGHLGTELLRDEEAPGRYLTVDRWASAQAYQAFRRDHADEYNALDARCEGLTEWETFLGAFERAE